MERDVGWDVPSLHKKVIKWPLTAFQWKTRLELLKRASVFLSNSVSDIPLFYAAKNNSPGCIKKLLGCSSTNIFERGRVSGTSESQNQISDLLCCFQLCFWQIQRYKSQRITFWQTLVFIFLFKVTYGESTVFSQRIATSLQFIFINVHSAYNLVRPCILMLKRLVLGREELYINFFNKL